VPNFRRRFIESAAAVIAAILFVLPAHADVVTKADLQIQGSSLAVVDTVVTTQLGATAFVHTSFGGLQDDQAPVIEGLSAVGDLTGPGITTPIQLVTAPGHAFQISGLSQEGIYYLQNVRLMNGTQLLQLAVPSVAAIQVANTLKTTVTVRQLTPDEMRSRGINVDPSNYDVYEYTFSFLVNGQTVTVPYPVIINRTTHEPEPGVQEDPYHLPQDLQGAPPRWVPPSSGGIFILPDIPEFGNSADPPADPLHPNPRPQIHCAIVIPNSLAVLHQFFAVGLVVANGAPAGSNVKLDSVTASIDVPNQLRIAKVDPPTTFGQPVTIKDPNNPNVTFLIAQATGQADWTLEGLKPGTYTVNLDVKATFQSPGQPDLPLEAKPQATVVIHDARFNITFSHPDTIRKNLQYSTYTYITNISDAAQTITLSDQGLPTCSSGGYLANVCRIDTSPSSFTLTLQPGETKSVQYKLQSSLTGHIFATAASIDGDNSAISAATFQLVMGVSPTGVPLSPATLILPHYATTPYISQNLLDAELGYLGIAYSLATAPLNNQTAKFPRLITTDVFARAVDLARTGERIFIGEDPRASLANFTLDSLGNGNPLAEWDQFLRQEVTDVAGDTARGLESAIGAELSTAFSQSGGTFNDLADRFAASTTDRGPYVLALVHGAKSSTAASAFDVQVTSAAGLVLGVDATQSSGWKRQIPWGGLFPLSGSVEAGTLAVIGRSNEALDLTITPSVSGAATIDLIFPAADGVTLTRASASFTAAAGQVVHVHIANGVATSNDVAPVAHLVPLAPVSIVAARQDTFLDNDGHTVSVLFNRRLPATSADLAPDFDTDVVLDSSKFGVGYTGKRTVAGAALQPDRRIIHVNYDSALSSDVQYQIHTSNLVDPASNATVVPVVDVRNSALLLGTVLHGDNSIVPNAQLFLTTKTGRQYQRSDTNGKFLFEYIPRDPDASINGDYDILANAEGRQTSLEGTVRLLHSLTQISVVFLGRGSAQGTVRYEDGTRVPNATVVVGSALFRQFRTTTTKSDGTYSVTDLPVGPLTFSAQDAAGNVAYAANELHAGGEVAVQDISIFRQPFPGVGTVYGRVIRNDTNAPVAGAHVGVYSQGYGFSEIFTDATGTFSFPKVPAGFVTVLAANFGISPTEVAVDFDLKANESHNMGDFILVIPTANTVMVSVDGDVTAEDPLIPGSFHAVPNAQVQINGMPVVVANAAGHYHYDSVPQTMSGSSIMAYDPATRRGVKKSIPDLLPYSPATPTNNIPLAITNTSGSGKGTIRVHLLSAAGKPISGYHVFWSDTAQMWSAAESETESGVYEFGNLAVGTTLPIIAAPVSGSDPTYGWQMATGSATVSFPGQIAAITLRLKGQGTVTANIQQQTQSGVFIKLAGRLSASFTAWDNAELDTIVRTIFADTNGTTDAVFNKIPVLPTPSLIQTVEAAGYASTGATIGYDGAVVPKTLTLSTLAEVRGHVFAPDGYTPVAGAAVHMTDNNQDLGIAVTGFDGSFDYKNIVPSSRFSVTADYTINGIYRTAITTGATPENGGVVDNVRLILQEQGSVEGTVVDSNNNPVPFAKIWLRELSYPSRELGTAADPRFTDGAGHFRFNNIFAVGVRVSAEDPVNPESRGDWGGAVTKENDVQTAAITLSSTGLGSVRITVLDPNNALAPVPNAEVSLYRGGLFDFGTTDASGSIQFDQLPVDNQADYHATAFSKTQFKSGATASNFAINKNQTTTASIILTFSGEVTGNLVDPQNNNVPVPGSNVTLFGDYIGNFYQTRDTTAADGTFDFKGVREGNFKLEAREPNSIRMARGTGLVSAVFPTATIPLALEPTSTLTVKAFLPNDAGGNSGVLAPLVNIDVVQSAPGGSYLRSSQTNGAQFPGLVRTANDHPVGIDVSVHELGGLNRVARASTNFDPNTAAKELDVIFSASGTVNVTVKAGSPPAPIANVQVTASGGGSGRSAYTDANGFVSLSGLPLGNVSIQAATQGATPLTGSTSVALTSQTTPATANIILGSYGGVTGKVIAEGTVSSPSAGTRVFASLLATQLETRTDSTGAYTFQGIATPANGLTVHLIYLGPDDNTIGGQQDVILLSGQGIVTAPDITLDSTPPRLIGIFPADGASKVAPDTQLKFTFNRAMRGDQLTSGGNGYFHLFDSAAGTELTMTLASALIQPDNTQVITFNTPPKPPGQNFPLKSNTLYRIKVSGTLLDLANHILGADLGSSFTTSDYSAPQVTKVDPSPKQPLTKNGVRIAVTFSKPLGPQPWQSGGSGSMTFVEINAIGGQIIGSPIAGTVQLDPISGATLYYAPNVTLNPASFYRLSVSGVVDTDGRAMVDANGQPLSVFTQDFFTYDAVAPVVTIGTPLINGVAIGNSDPLYLSVLYTIPVTLLNPDGSAVTDLDRVDFWSVDAGGNITPITKTSPTTVAIAAPPGTTTFTLRADAWDLSLNKGTATRSWTVAAQPPLTINSTTIAPATVYPGGSLTDTVQIGGGGLDANVTVTATLDGSSTTLVSAATSISRHLFTDPWPSAALSLTIPRSVAGGAKVNLTTSVSDIRGFSASPKVDSITMATDAVAPVSQPVTIDVVRNVPATPALTFNNGDQYRVRAFASDAETGVASMTFTIDGTPYTVNAAPPSIYHSSTGVWEFVSPTITVQSHNNDAAIAINARATDYAGNSSSASASVTYLGIHDPNAPTVAWIAPLHDGAWPANVTNFTAKLRLFASSPLPLIATFDVPGAGTLTATRTGNELNVTLNNFTTPAAGTAFQIVARVSDGDGGHRIDLPINIDIVTTGQTIPSGGTIAVDATHPLVSDSVVVDGGRLILYVPTTLKNLIVINGGIVDTVPSTTAADQKIDLTITDHLYVDGDSSVDVSRRGYMGGLEANADSSGSNPSPNGVTRGRVTTGGATSGASGSYAGIGGDDAGATNATYGSITAPVDLGSGGAADSTSRRGGQGGGSTYIHAATGGLGKVVVAGALLGDGESGVNIGGAGSGGSIHVTANEIVLGAMAKISASGGDDDGSTSATRAGGGGRVSLEASQLLDIDSSNGTHVFALGGRNNAGETAGTLDGGAGTIFLRNAGEVNGELFISALDSRFPSNTVHLTRATPLAGTLTFDKVTLGARALARADASITIAGVADDKTKATIDGSAKLLLQGDLPTLTVTTNPAAGSNLIQGTSLGLTYTAASLAGVGGVTYALAPAVAAHTDSLAYQPAPAQQTPSIVVPGSAAPGTATLTVRVTDRAGRTFDAAPSTFTIVANQAPVITNFALTAPNPFYIGNSISAAIAATDEVAVKTLSLTTQIGSGTPSTQTFTANGASASTTFTVPVAKDPALDGQTVTLTAKADDGTAPPVTSVKTLTIAHDANPPVVTITQPAANAGYTVGVGLIHVVATVIDAESGVVTNTITASIPGSTSKPMTATANANEYAADLSIPFEPGIDPVTVNVTVTASDLLGNARSASTPVQITPKFDPTAPVVTWNCGASGVLAPAGSTIPLSVTAVPGSSGTAIFQVTFNDGTNTFTATASGSTYTYNYAIPANTPDGTVITILASALTNGQGTGTQQAQITVVAIDKTISADKTIQSNDLSYDFQNVAITGGTTTLIGHHEFKKLIILNGATLTQTPTTTTATFSLDVKAASIYVACGGSIDVDGKGYAGGQSYPGVSVSVNNSGGSHIGLGIGDSGTAGATYGNVEQPQEAGAGAGVLASGGGIIRINATSLANDGAIRANGVSANSRNSAGGSIWITTGTLDGTGSIESKGFCCGFAASGGGAISINYASLQNGATLLNNAVASGGAGNGTGGAGSVYIKGPTSTFGSLTIDDKGPAGGVTQLPSMGNGIAQAGSSGAVLVTDSPANILGFFVGHWVEVRDASGILKGTWHIGSINAKTVTLTPNGNETIAVQPGDLWQGVYQFDSVQAPNGDTIKSSDPIRIGANGVVTLAGPSTAGKYLEVSSPITGNTVTVTGNVSVPSITAQTLTVSSGATLSVPVTSPPGALTINVSGTMTVQSGAVIDVSGRGYPGGQTYPGVSASVNNSGGSHIGLGVGDSGTAGAAYGNVEQPQEAGAGAGALASGGGVVRINAGTLIDNGAIRANGVNTGSRNSAGGSIWITTGTLDGTGSVESRGICCGFAASGGGAISINYTTLQSGATVLNNAVATGGSGNGTGGAGTIFVKGPGSTFGTLSADNKGQAGAITQLPSMGNGIAQAGSSGAILVTDSPANILGFFAGHWVEVRDASGTLKGTWHIGSINAKTVTLTPNGGETINVAAGDLWQGVYQFDSMQAPNGDTIKSNDPIRIGANGVANLTGPTAAGKFLEVLYPITATAVTVTGNVSVPSITAQTLTVSSGATLAVPASSPPTALAINVSGTVTVQSGGAIDVSGRGYPGGQSYPGVSASVNNSGGSHIGLGVGDSGTPGAVYGNIEQPQEAGAGAGAFASGGGGVRINAATLIDNGAIRANGVNTSSRNSAGGSIWITTGTLDGTGSVESRGICCGFAASGGGAISINYTTLQIGSTVLNNALANGGSGNGTGGAGTIFVKGPGSTFGALTIDNKGQAGTSQLPALGNGFAQTGSGGATLVTNAASNILGFFAGHWVEVLDATNGSVKGIWRIASINNKTVTLAPNGNETISVAAGDSWRGVYRFDTVTVHGSTVLSGDRVDGTATADNGGRLLFNAARPQFDVAKIAQILIQPTTNGNATIVAPAGTLTDADNDGPYSIVATNTRTNAPFTGAANADGSFNVAVTGASPDVFTLIATDSGTFPISSVPATISNWAAPPVVSSVTFNPATVSGSTTATGTLTLSAAPAASVTVPLTSTSPSTAAVPASVTVSAGQTTATFTVTAVNPTADGAVTITATLSGTPTTGIITVRSVSPSVTMTPNPVTGGHADTGTVTLTLPAPANGAVVNLSSSSAVAAVPASVTIVAGATTANFNITTQIVTSPQSATITSTYGAVSTTAALSVVVDASPPAIAITAPAQNTAYAEGTGQITVTATVTDAETGVGSVVASIDGVTHPMTAPTGSSTYSVTFAAPFVDGTSLVTKQLVVTGTDKAGNSANASEPIVINPNTDPAAPSLSWTCISSGATLPTNYSAKLRATALPPSSSNLVASVVFTLDDGTSLPASLIGNDVYEATWPTGATAKIVTVTATATASGGTATTLTSVVAIVAADQTFTSSGSISATNTTWESKVVVVSGTSTTVTIDGQHNFAKLIVLDGATVVETSGLTNPLSLGTKTNLTDVYVSCGSAIDVSGRGYGANSSYPGASLPSDVNGGSHIGAGGIRNNPGASTFGSVYHPREAGGGGNCGGTGGGVLFIVSAATVIDGSVNARGTNTGGNCSDRSAAGGSIWITTARIGGAGRIDAGATNTTWGSGGGGAIAIEYSDSTSILPTLASIAGTSSQGFPGGAGSIYVKGPSSPYGDLTVDNGSTFGTTNLPSFGSGTAQSGTAGDTLVTGKPSAIPTYFAGNWIQITSGGVVKGIWRIGTINDTTVTLTPNATETISLSPGDNWQGVYRFDNVTLRSGRLETAGTDPVLANGAETIDGTVEHELINAASLRVRSGATLTHRQGNSLSIITTGETRIEPAGAIDVTARGFTPNVTYPGLTAPSDVNGGSHMGVGGIRNAPGGSPYGSVYRPLELGGGGNCAGIGGGAVRIQSGSTVIDGNINSRGTTTGGNCSDRSAAGGSVWIATGKISGAGKIDTSAANTSWGSGGGGAIAIEYTDPTSSLPVLASATGTSSQSIPGGAGTIYVKGANATYGDLTVDNAGITGQSTVLSSLGSGTAQSGTSGSTLVTGRSSNIPAYFAGNWVQISSGGTVKGTWRIGTVTPNSATVSLAPNGNETISLSAGDTWQGVYLFDNLRIQNGGRLNSADAVQSGGNLTVQGPVDLLSPITTTGNVTIAGAVTAVQITAASLTVNSGAVLTQGNTDALRLTVSDTLTVLGSVDVSGHGFGSGTTYPGATTATDVDGGSHIGIGGIRNTPGGSTFGSVYRPQEAGGGAAGGGAGGGVIRIQAGNAVVVNGTINAKGSLNGGNNDRSGGGGSVWISTGKISGSGRIDTSSVNATWGAGGGGAIAIEYTDPTSSLPVLASATGASNQGYPAGAGSIYVKGANATYGDLTVDNAGQSGQPTVLPSLGSGTALTGTGGNTLVTDRGSDIPTYFSGNWVQITSATGTVKGTWRIGTVSSRTVTLAPNGSETISLAAGDAWQGVYRFDNITLRGVRLETTGVDPILTAGAETIDSGTVEHELINANSLHVRAGATLTHRGGNPLSITTQGETRVDATGAIDVSGRGYVSNATYSGATAATDVDGGSHIGIGGIRNNPGGSTFGSVYRPQEFGGGAAGGGAGGGAIRIQSGTAVIDGFVHAKGSLNGGNNDRSGGGGSIWITTGKISGAGRIDTGSVNATWGSGGGGAISIEYTDPTSTLPVLASATGTSNQGYPGGAGSIYVKGANSTYGDLTVDNAGQSGQPTVLPSLGSGTAQTGTAGSTLVTGRSSNIPGYFGGNWIQVSSGGSVKGTWRIGTVMPNSATVTLVPNGSETISLSVGDTWQGVYRFDNITLRNVRLETTGADPILAAGAETIDGGTVEHELINANSLRIRTGTILTHRTGNQLSITTQGEVRVEANAFIDVSARGYGSNATYPGANAATDVDGGSHMGIGGIRNNPGGSSFGSVYRPQESGGGAAGGGFGGGAVRIQSGTAVIDGNIHARGSAVGGPNGDRSGAGGSVWIATGKITGAGKIDTGSVNTTWGSGGGGAISIEYTDPTSSLPVLASASGTSSQGYPGGAGTIYVKGANATYGDLTVDNAGISGQPTVLPSLGSGTAQTGTAGSTLVTGRSSTIPPYFAGNWVQISSGGTLKGTWRIGTVTPNSATVTLVPNGSETISLSVGDTWQGVYRFDNITLRNVRLETTGADPILAAGAETIDGGTVEHELINANSLRIRTGTILTHRTGNQLSITTQGEVRVEANAFIDVSARGYGSNATYPGANAATDVDGGSHMGIGGIRNNPGGSSFGSVYRPQESGGGAAGGGFGGGAVRIQSGTAVIDGNIHARGSAVGGPNGDRSGAGGSVWIATGKITGAGKIDTGSVNTTWGSGGGGAIAIEYTDPTSSLPVLASASGTSSQGYPGGAGTIYVKGATATYGVLTVDNAGQTGQPTVLPSLGSGTALTGTSGSTLVTDRTVDIPAYFFGHWVEISSGATLKGTWRIGNVSGKTATLTPNGTETISLSAGDTWQGVYHFDSKTVAANTTLSSTDPIRLGTGGLSLPPAVQSLPSAGTTEQTPPPGRPSTGSVAIIAPVVVSEVRLDSASVQQGSAVYGVVLLTAPAPLGGAMVALSSSDAAAVPLPATVIVPEGSIVASFMAITSCAGHDPGDVTITATYGTARSATVKITDCSNK